MNNVRKTMTTGLTFRFFNRPIQAARYTCVAAAVFAMLAAGPLAGEIQDPDLHLEGIVSVAVADYFSPDKDGKMQGYSRMTYTVRVGEFEFVELEGDPDLLAKLKTGERVVLKGHRETPKRFVTTELISRAAGPDMRSEKAILGEQDMAVIPVQFPNLPLPTNCQWDPLNSIAFEGQQSIKAFWEEASFGQLFFSPESKTFDIITLPGNYTSGCNLNLWTAQADAILGSEIAPYNRRIYTFPSALTSVCPFGLGQVGGPGSGLTLSWITGCAAPDAYIHEVGHNLGLLHAWTPTTEYGDTGDIMGFGGVGVRKFNGPHTEDLDWLPEAHYKTLSGIGTYNETLTAVGRDYETEPNPTQVLKIYSPAMGKDLYITYRDNHGMDSSLGGQYQFKTHVHTKRLGTESTLIRVLSTNETYTVGPDGITIAQVSTSPSTGTANVRVIIETPNDCEEDTPEVTISSIDPAYTGPGGTINYTLDITNTDGFTCLPLEARLSAALPGLEWSANSPVEVVAAPGETTTSPVFSVTSPENVSGFTHNFSIIMTVPADIANEHTVVIPATYRLDRLAPTVPTGLLMTGTGPGSASMIWNPSTDSQSGVGYYEILRSYGTDNFAVIDQSPTPEYVDNAADDGSLLFYLLRAVDNAGNVSD